MKFRSKALLAGIVALAASGQQPGVVFKSSTSLVVLDVTVKDRSGKEITDLKREDFTVLEDGKPQNIAVFEVQKLAGEPLPALPAEPPKEAPKQAGEAHPGRQGADHHDRRSGKNSISGQAPDGDVFRLLLDAARRTRSARRSRR